MSRGKPVFRQYTIRNVPEAVDRALRQRAIRYRRSLNDIALEALATAAQVRVPGATDLDTFFGSWVEDPEVEAALDAQQKIDEDLWR